MFLLDCGGVIGRGRDLYELILDGLVEFFFFLCSIIGGFLRIDGYVLYFLLFLDFGGFDVFLFL